MMKSSKSSLSVMNTSMYSSMSKIFIFIVTKPFVCVTLLTVFKNILFTSSVFFSILINFGFIKETWEPGSYVPFTSLTYLLIIFLF